MVPDVGGPKANFLFILLKRAGRWRRGRRRQVVGGNAGLQILELLKCVLLCTFGTDRGEDIWDEPGWERFPLELDIEGGVVQ